MGFHPARADRPDMKDLLRKLLTAKALLRTARVSLKEAAAEVDEVLDEARRELRRACGNGDAGSGRT